MEPETGEPSIRFERLVAQHGEALGRLAATYAADRDGQEDLLQEILVAVWRALPAFRGECSERTFLFRIGHNRGITHRSRRRRHVAIDEAAEVADPRLDPERQFTASREQASLLCAVRALPETLRQVVSLHLEGFSHAEIADVLGISANNVAVRLARGRAALRRLLEEEEGPG